MLKSYFKVFFFVFSFFTSYAYSAIISGRDCEFYLDEEKKKSCKILKEIRCEEEKLSEWVYEEHLDDFCKVANDLNVIITVRKTGKPSIKRIGEGASSKGHDILEKTLKPSSLSFLKGLEDLSLEDPSKFYPKEWLGKNKKISGKGLLREIKKANLRGYVGWRVKNKDGVPIPVGVYTVASGCFYIVQDMFKAPHGGCRLTFRDLLQQGGRAKDMMTGDYDLHDILSISNRYSFASRVKSAFSGEFSQKKEGNYHLKYDYGNFYKACDEYAPELEVACSLNQAINPKRSCDNFWKPYPHCSLLRHGAQINYIEYQKETEEKFIPELVQVSQELAVIEPVNVLFSPKELREEDRCHYFLLGSNKESNFIREYKSLYALTKREEEDKKEFHPERIAVINTKDSMFLDKLMERKESSNLKKIESLGEELSRTFKIIKEKENLDLKRDCIEKLYQVEEFQSLVGEREEQEREGYDSVLEKHKVLLCGLEDKAISLKETCPSQVKRQNKRTENEAERIWMTMAASFCL